jgi:hypothetical protein
MRNILWVVCWLSLLVSLSSKSEEVTTENLLKDSTDTNINDVGTSNNSYGMEGAEFTTGNESLGGGSKNFDIDLSEYENIDSIKYGSTVYSHTSNSNLPACTDTTYDCRDEFKITVNLYNNSVLVKTYTHNYYDINWSGSNTYEYTQDVTSVVFNSAELELYGIDAGYPSGYYGPGFSDYYFTATYKIIETVIDQVLDSIEMDLIETSYEMYEDISFEIDIQDPQGDMLSFEFDLVEPEMVDIQIEAPMMEEIAPVEEMQTELDIDMNMEMEEIADEINIEMDITEEEPDSETAGESAVEAEEEGEQETIQPQQTKERVAQKIMARVIEEGNQTVLNNVKLAVMAQLADTEAFEQYQVKQITDNNFEVFMQEPLEDPYAILYDMGNDYLMEQMVNQQWQN